MIKIDKDSLIDSSPSMGGIIIQVKSPVESHTYCSIELNRRVVSYLNKLWFVDDMYSDEIVKIGDKITLSLQEVKHGNCPNDNRIRPIYIKLEGVRKLAVADGKGDAYAVYGEGYDMYNSVPKPENKYSLDCYEFERGLSGMDF